EHVLTIHRECCPDRCDCEEVWRLFEEAVVPRRCSASCHSIHPATSKTRWTMEAYTTLMEHEEYSSKIDGCGVALGGCVLSIWAVDGVVGLEKSVNEVEGRLDKWVVGVGLRARRFVLPSVFRSTGRACVGTCSEMTGTCANLGGAMVWAMVVGTGTATHREATRSNSVDQRPFAGDSDTASQHGKHVNAKAVSRRGGQWLPPHTCTR
ncbi:hypothetical protein CRUP_008713, partial [Coryphaenoides rupestris]